MAQENYSAKQLLQMDACTRCLRCADVCPAFKASEDPSLSSAKKLDTLKKLLKNQRGLLSKLFPKKEISEEEWSEFSKQVFQCTLCAHCEEVCPVGISLKEIWLSLRSDLVCREFYPKKIDAIVENLENSYNVFDEDNEDRAMWAEDIRGVPDHLYQHDQAEVVYFTGCVASYFPMAQKIPMAFVQILDAAGVNFTLLGEDEWCCGFPLLGAGLKDKAGYLIEHNKEAIKAKGAKEVVFACPSCYQIWRELYKSDFALSHASNFMLQILREGKVPLKKLDLTVTYHDPCDLGRGGRTFEQPREVIRLLPGVRLVEMDHNRENCLCCGGGGNLEMVAPELSSGIAAKKIDDIKDTGAGTVVTSCQQCVRTMTTYARRNEVNVQVMDLIQLVHMALDETKIKKKK